MTSPAELAPRRTALALWLWCALLWGAAALLLRWHATPGALDVDEQEYWTLAGQLLSGSYRLHPRRVLAMPVLLAIFRALAGGRLLLAQLGVTLVASLAAPILYLVARRELRHERAARLAALGLICWPLFIKEASTFYSDSVGLTCVLWFVLVNRADSPPARRFAAGLVLGLCMQVRPMYLLYAPFAALGTAQGLRSWPARASAVALVAAGAVAAVLPWSAALSSLSGRTTFLGGNAGEVLAGGFNQKLLHEDRMLAAPDGRPSWSGPGKWLHVGETGYLTEEEVRRLPYPSQDQLLAERACAWISAHPAEAGFLALRKLTTMWGLLPFWNGLVQTAFGNLPTLALLLLSAAALARLRGALCAVHLFWTLPLFVSAVGVVSWGSWRFRLPGDAGLLVLAATLPWSSELRQGLRGLPPAGR